MAEETRAADTDPHELTTWVCPSARLFMILWTVTLLTIAQSDQTLAGDATTVNRYHVAPQPLGTALTQLAEQSGMQILFKPDEIGQFQSNGLEGRHSIETALGLLLEGTPFSYEIGEGETIVVKQPQNTAQTPSRYMKKTAAQATDEQPTRGVPQGEESISSGAELSRTLEEVVVTAQKREEALGDVPIAISAISGDALRASNLARLEDLSATIPSLTISEAVSASDNMFLRGIGSGVNLGFEQAVGQVIDGFFYGRSRFGRAAFLDVERVEVLKGPQGALIGKNTTGGAINITTAKPTDSFEAWFMPVYEVIGNDGFTFEGAVSGPLTETLMARFALRYDDRDGFVENIATGSEDSDRQDLTTRVTVLWEPTEDLAVTLAYQHGDLESRGRTRQLSRCGAPLLNFLAANGLQDDCKLNFKRNTLDVRNGEVVDEVFDTRFDTVNLTMSWDVLGHTVTSLTGFAQYDMRDSFDTDFLPIESLSVNVSDDYKQWSQELRLNSGGDGPISYVAGFFFQTFEQDTDFTVHFVGVPPPIRGARNTVSHQESTTLALFGQLTWELTDTVSATTSARYTYEGKDAEQIQFATAPFGTTPISLPGGPAALTHDIADDRTEQDFSPGFSLQWFPRDGVMTYGSVRRGFKGGGFDLQLNANQTDAEAQFQFGAEDVIAYELGAKLMLLDRRAEVNVALFRSEFSDLQVSSITGQGLNFNVGNAASAITQGLEIDARWLVTDAFTISTMFAYLDAEYDDYEGAPCYFGQSVVEGCVGGVQDLSGRSLQFAPEVSATVTGEYVWPLTGNLELAAMARLIYSGSYALALDLDPNMEQDNFYKLDSTLTLRSTDKRWSVSLVARNLNNVITSNFGNDASGAVNAGSYFRFPEPPRSVALQARVNF